MREARKQDTLFDGSIPELYDRFLGPLLFEQYAQDVARRVRELGPKNVLEIAAGTGIPGFHRVLSAAGIAIMSVWDSFEHNPAPAIIHEILIDAFPVDPPDFYEVPLGYHDVTELRRVATAAGFADVRIETLALDGASTSASDAATGLVRGNPVVNMIRERAPHRQAEIEARTKERLEERFGLGPLNVPTQAHIMTATK